MLTGILQCIVLSHFNTGQEPFYQQNADRYYCQVLSYLFSIQIKNHFTNRMLTGILFCIVLPLFNTGQTHFYQQNADRYIAVCCLTSLQYRSNLCYLQNGDRYIVVNCFISLLLQIKRHIFNLFTSLIISPTD